jgi:hypothetical protein
MKNYQTIHLCRNPRLGLATKVRGYKVAGQEEVGSHVAYSRQCKKVWGKATPTWGVGLPMDSRNFIKQLQGSKLFASRVLYIIRKLLKHRCPKWARITHLDICNTSYGQKKGRESNWQFDSRPRKVGNRPDLLACRRCATRR